jgi:hypothetical protein
MNTTEKDLENAKDWGDACDQLANGWLSVIEELEEQLSAAKEANLDSQRYAMQARAKIAHIEADLPNSSANANT